MPDESTNRTAVVALGANLGDAAETVRAAIERLRPLSAGNFRASTLWETEPFDCPPGSSPFTNAAVAFLVKEEENPESLLDRLHTLESGFGRRRSGQLNEPRTLDLDLIAFGEERRNSPALILPHPRAHERTFVLGPLAEILPDFRAPGWPACAAELLRKLSRSG